MHLNHSPLRYPGSKRKLLKYFDKVLSFNNMAPQILVEPFVGGGSVFLHFLLNKNTKKIIIADKDILIYSFWKTLFCECSHLIRFIKSVKVNLNTFDRYRTISDNPNKHSITTLAEACLFLNRTSFSGILNSGAGPIGGRRQTSQYKIDCRFGRENLIKKIEKIAAFRNRVTVLCCDWADTINYAIKSLKYPPNEILFYLDPPFYKKADQLYRHFFEERDHEILRNTVIGLKQSWILSYDKARQIEKLYSNSKSLHVQAPYSINSPATRLEKELIITSFKLPLL
jgi:DNA adenine methylase